MSIFSADCCPSDSPILIVVMKKANNLLRDFRQSLKGGNFIIVFKGIPMGSIVASCFIALLMLITSVVNQSCICTFHLYLSYLLVDLWKKPRITLRRDSTPPGEDAQIDFGLPGTCVIRKLTRGIGLRAFAPIISFNRHCLLK